MRQNKFGKMLRWLAWASLWTLFHPEITIASNWIDEPLHNALSVLLYMFSGALLELIYNYLMTGEFSLNPSQRTKRPASTKDNPWRLFVEARPPVKTEIELYCADETVRKGMIVRVNDGNLVFEVEYEEEVQAHRLAKPMEYCPLYWRNLARTE